LSIKAYQSL